MSSIGSVGGFRPPPPKPPSFETLDSDSNGSVSLDEFKSSAPKDADSAKTEKLFKSIDSDGSGSISKDESDAFQAKAEKAHQQLQSFLFGLQSGGTEKASDGSTDSDDDDSFGKVDTDSSGSVSKDEFLKAFSAEGSSGSSGRLSKLFDAIDSNSDSSISKDEQKAFQKAAQERHQDRGPPPSGASFGASQAYGNAAQLGSQSWLGSNSNGYSQAA